LDADAVAGAEVLIDPDAQSHGPNVGAAVRRLPIRPCAIVAVVETGGPAEPIERVELQRSERDPATLRAGLDRWLAARWPGSAVTELEVPSSNGMSSETVLFTATTPDAPEGRRLVARVAPQ